MVTYPFEDIIESDLIFEDAARYLRSMTDAEIDDTDFRFVSYSWNFTNEYPYELVKAKAIKDYTFYSVDFYSNELTMFTDGLNIFAPLAFSDVLYFEKYTNLDDILIDFTSKYYEGDLFFNFIGTTHFKGNMQFVECVGIECDDTYFILTGSNDDENVSIYYKLAEID